MYNYEIHELLESALEEHNKKAFISDDPIGIPHQFKLKQDIEIIAFWTAVIAWGQRKTIIANANKLVNLMDGAPYEFIKNHNEKERARFEHFIHRTFLPTDAIYMVDFLQRFYNEYDSLELGFSKHIAKGDSNIKNGLIGFHHLFFDCEYAPERTRKHIATPERGSTCKRLNMFLRWMVRKDEQGVDFGIWKKISPAQLLMPLDVHVERVARRLNLIQRKHTDWKTVEELTANLKIYDQNDPVKYDFALFGIGVNEKKMNLIF